MLLMFVESTTKWRNKIYNCHCSKQEKSGMRKKINPKNKWYEIKTKKP